MYLSFIFSLNASCIGSKIRRSGADFLAFEVFWYHKLILQSVMMSVLNPWRLLIREAVSFTTWRVYDSVFPNKLCSFPILSSFTTPVFHTTWYDATASQSDTAFVARILGMISLLALAVCQLCQLCSTHRRLLSWKCCKISEKKYARSTKTSVSLQITKIDLISTSRINDMLTEIHLR